MHKKGAVFGFQFGKVLPFQREHPSTCYFSIIKYQVSSTDPSSSVTWMNESMMTDGATITLLIWYLLWPLPTTAAPMPCGPGPVPHSRDTRTPPHTDGLSATWSLKPQSQLVRAVWMVCCTPQTPNLLFAVCKSHPFTHPRLLQPLTELKPSRKHQDLIV